MPATALIAEYGSAIARKRDAYEAFKYCRDNLPNSGLARETADAYAAAKLECRNAREAANAACAAEVLAA